MKEKAKQFFQKHWADSLLFLLLLFSTTIGTIFALLGPNTALKMAMVYREDECILTLNLEIPNASKIENPTYAKALNLEDFGEEVEAVYQIEGVLTPMVVAISEEGVAILSSGCPSQYCVSLGYTLDPRRPIVCAYNHVYIEFSSEGEDQTTSSSGPDIIV